VGGAPVASYIVQKDQQEGTFFLSPSLKQRAAKQWVQVQTGDCEGLGWGNRTIGGAGGMVGIRGRGDMWQKDRGREDSAFNCPGLKVNKHTVKNVESRCQCLTNKESKVRTEMQGWGKGKGEGNLLQLQRCQKTFRKA